VGYTTIKVPRELKERLEEYARPKGLTLSGAIDQLLSEGSLKEELREIRELLREQNRLLRQILEELKRKEIREFTKVEREKEEVREEAGEELPSFVVGNPWVKVISEK